MPMQANVDSKRVAKNTIVLYFRMLFQMVVFFYTSRVVMKSLVSKTTAFTMLWVQQ